MIWPNPPTENFSRELAGGKDLFHHWEKVLYEHYWTVYRDTGKVDAFAQRIKTFADRLDACTLLKARYRRDISNRRQARTLHQIITLLYFYYDMVERDAMRGVFSVQPPRAWMTPERCDALANLRKAQHLVQRALPTLDAEERVALYDALFSEDIGGDPLPGPVLIRFAKERTHGNAQPFAVFSLNRNAKART